MVTNGAPRGRTFSETVGLTVAGSFAATDPPGTPDIIIAHHAETVGGGFLHSHGLGQWKDGAWFSLAVSRHSGQAIVRSR
jgi:hypothetical protein